MLDFGIIPKLGLYHKKALYKLCNHGKIKHINCKNLNYDSEHNKIYVLDWERLTGVFNQSNDNCFNE